MNLTETYKYLIENPQLCYLVPIENTLYQSDSLNTDYIIYGRSPLGFAIIPIPDDDWGPLSGKLIEVGVEIKENIAYEGESFEQIVQHLWTDEKHEYALIKKDNHYHTFNMLVGRGINVEAEDPNFRNQVIQNMINAGVEIWDKFPDEE